MTNHKLPVELQQKQETERFLRDQTDLDEQLQIKATVLGLHYDFQRWVTSVISLPVAIDSSSRNDTLSEGSPLQKETIRR